MADRGDLQTLVAQTLPHQPPFRLVDRLLSNEGGVAVAERQITVDDPLSGGALPESLVIEALAQTAALIAGAEVGRHEGYLVALRGVKFESRAELGDTLRLRAERTGMLGALHRVSGEAHVGDRLVARGELTFQVVA